MTDPFTPEDRFQVELSGPTQVTTQTVSRITSVTVSQGPAKWTLYDLASVDALIDAFMEAKFALEVAQAQRGECGVCGLPDQPLCDSVPKWINDGQERETVARCFGCAEGMDAAADARSAA